MKFKVEIEMDVHPSWNPTPESIEQEVNMVLGETYFGASSHRAKVTSVTPMNFSIQEKSAGVFEVVYLTAPEPYVVGKVFEVGGLWFARSTSPKFIGQSFLSREEAAEYLVNNL